METPINPVGLRWRPVCQYQCGGQCLLGGAWYNLQKAIGWTTGNNMELTHKLVKYPGKGNSADLTLVSRSSGVQDCSYTMTGKEWHECPGIGAPKG